MEDAGARSFRANNVGPKLTEGERVDQGAEKPAVSHHRFAIEIEDRSDKPGISYVAFGALDKTLQSVGRVRGDTCRDVERLEETFVDQCRLSVEARGVVQCLVVDDSGGVRSDGLEEPAQTIRIANSPQSGNVAGEAVVQI